MDAVVNEIRRANVELLIAQFGSIAKLNEVLGRNKKDGTFSQIRNRTRGLGNGLAIEIERRLQLTIGWMDNDHSEEGLSGLNIVNGEEDSLFVYPLTIKMASSSKFVKGNESIIGKLSISKTFLRSVLGLSGAQNLAFSVSPDRSCFPTFPANATFLMDLGCKEYKGDGFYLLQINSQINLFFIQQLVGGNFKITSYTTGVYEEISSTDTLSVLGRIIYSWVGKKL